MGNGRGRPTGTEADRERRKGRQTGARRTAEIRRKKASVGGERGGLPGVLRGRGCRLDLELTISGTGTTGEWSWHSGEWPRPTWTWSSSGNQFHGCNLHPQVVWVKHRLYGHAKPTLQRSGCVLPAITKFYGGGRAPVWPQRRRLPAGDGSAAVVHHWMLPRPRRHLNNR